MEYKCIFCRKKVKTNDASFSVNVNADGQEKKEIIDTVFEGDICSWCANHFSMYVNKINEWND